ncbi:MAG: cysteine desulfurase family protein [Acidimicrobiales bacterium]
MAVYLDHAATTPLRPEALEAMMPWFTDCYGNASGGHRLAREARRAVDEARESTAEVLGCRPGELVFTGGGTESDNAAVAGVVAAAVRSGSPAGVVCSAIEHHAVLHAVEAVGGRTAPVDADGRIDLNGLAATLGPDVGLVSVMLANNEIGTIQDLDAVGGVVRAHAPGAVLHTDAVQAAPWLDLRRTAAAAGLVSIAAHKFGGPQGVGALVVRQGVRIEPILRGGGQERELRSGTHNVAGIVGLAAALRAAAIGREAAVERVAALRDTLIAGICARVAGVDQTATGAHRLPNIGHLRFAGVENESVLMLLDDVGVCAAAGSSCASGAMEPSHVLAAIGLSRPEARSSVRFSLGVPTTADEIVTAVDAVAAAVGRLRSARMAQA